MASVVTSSWVKSPVMMALPSVMADWTVAVLMFSSSSQMLMTPLSGASSVVAAENFSVPALVKDSCTT